MKKMAGKKTSRKLDRPFAPAIWEAGGLISRRYRVVLWQEDGQWFGHGLEMPGVFGGGPTAAEAHGDTLEALHATVAYILEKGERPPPPASEGQRTEQVNVRLSAEEKLRLETSAKRRGFKGVSDFIRAAALNFAE